MSTEDKVIAAIFSNQDCAYCQKREEHIKYPDILVNGRLLSDYIYEVEYFQDPLEWYHGEDAQVEDYKEGWEEVENSEF